MTDEEYRAYVAGGGARYDRPEESIYSGGPGGGSTADPNDRTTWGNQGGTLGKAPQDIQKTDSFVDPYFRGIMESNIKDGSKLPEGLDWGNWFRGDEYYQNQTNEIFDPLAQSIADYRNYGWEQVANDIERTAS